MASSERTETSVTTISHNTRLDKLTKILEILEVLEKDFLACKVKWTLFCTAVFSSPYNLNIKSLPPYFKLPSRQYDIKELRNIIKFYYRFENLFVYLLQSCVDSIDADLINLLYWIYIINCEQRLHCVETNEFLNAMKGTKHNIGEPLFVVEIEDLNPNIQYQHYKSRFGVLHFDSRKLYSLIHHGTDQMWQSSNFLVLRNTILPNPVMIDPVLLKCGLASNVIALLEYKYHHKYVQNIDGFKSDEKFTFIFNDKLATIKYLLFYANTIKKLERPLQKTLKSFLQKMILFASGGTFIYSNICILTGTRNALLPEAIVNMYLKVLKSL